MVGYLLLLEYSHSAGGHLVVQHLFGRDEGGISESQPGALEHAVCAQPHRGRGLNITWSSKTVNEIDKE